MATRGTEVVVPEVRDAATFHRQQADTVQEAFNQFNESQIGRDRLLEIVQESQRPVAKIVFKGSTSNQQS